MNLIKHRFRLRLFIFQGGIFMQTALLHNGNAVNTIEYDESIHGSRLFCIDKNCQAPLIYVGKSSTMNAHFKTTGKGDSRHLKGCGFYERLDILECVNKTKEYQTQMSDSLSETIIRLSMNRIDPDYQSKTIERETKEEKNEEKKVKLKNETETPQSISSVKGEVKLLTEYEPDLLATILINVGNGRKIPISELIVNQQDAHHLLWLDRTLPKVGYFVYGLIDRVIKREKVMYINFKKEDDVPFTIVIFQKYWKEFSYTEEDLVGQHALVYGNLRKNEYEGNQKTEMLIKGDKYLEKFKTKKQLNNINTTKEDE